VSARATCAECGADVKAENLRSLIDSLGACCSQGERASYVIEAVGLRGTGARIRHSYTEAVASAQSLAISLNRLVEVRDCAKDQVVARVMPPRRSGV